MQIHLSPAERKQLLEKVAKAIARNAIETHDAEALKFYSIDGTALWASQEVITTEGITVYDTKAGVNIFATGTNSFDKETTNKIFNMLADGFKKQQKQPVGITKSKLKGKLAEKEKALQNTLSHLDKLSR